MEHHRVVVYKDRYFSRVKIATNLFLLDYSGPWNTHQNTLGVSGTIVLLFYTRYTCSHTDSTSTMSNKKRIILGCLFCLLFNPEVLTNYYELPENMDKAKLELAAIWEDPPDLLWNRNTLVLGSCRICITHIVFAVDAMIIVMVWDLLFWIPKTDVYWRAKLGTNYCFKRNFEIIHHERISKNLSRFSSILISYISSKFGVWFQTSCSLCNTHIDKR